MDAPFASTVDTVEADRIISIAILAVGGQGGGVLTEWIVDTAERNSYRAQSTSVAGVAQRTGATIYYIEMCPDRGRQPIFSLSPTPGDVDVLIAAELMEAGRAILRGFVTPDRTTLIASAHRIAAVSEKIVPGDGRGRSEEVDAAARKAAMTFISFDMEKIAVETGSVISASLFGALAGSGTLPFPRESFEETIRASGRGVEASLRAFGRACETAAKGEVADDAASPSPARPIEEATGSPRLVRAWRQILDRIAKLPAAVQEMARFGAQKVVDYQDPEYGMEYLDRLDRAIACDSEEKGYELSKAAAKYLANALCYDDIIRVADLKTRSTRSARVRREVGVPGEAVLHVTEYFHPRIEEFCGTLPARLGSWIEARPGLARWLDKRLNKGRHIRTDGVFGFSALWAIAGLKRWRRSLLRHRVETTHVDAWYKMALDRAQSDYSLAVEILKCRRLIKGYSDTHARGLSKYDRVISAIAMLEGRDDGADWLRRLREAALKDEKGEMLDGALATIASFAGGADAGPERDG
ncbi:MAG: indolepyruvate oxidoreductase subunit beta family protein [Rhizobiaceae bacterium]|nr:MAG: indolepyruvate oxidoreductase subunit beta family protein [Rhizobiaceae bacterium]